MFNTEVNEQSIRLLKFIRRVEELEQRRYVDMIEITPMHSMEDRLAADEIHNSPPEIINERSLVLGDIFKGFDKYLWMEKLQDIPLKKEGFDIIGLFDYGKTGSGGNSGFESLLYIDKSPYQAIDSNHKDVILNNYAGQSIRLTFMLWSGLQGGRQKEPFYHKIEKAHIGYLHKDSNELYYYCKAISKTLHLLPDNDVNKHNLSIIMDGALKLINWDSDKFIETATNALTYLKGELAKLKKHSDITVHCIGHTHIDVAWLWRLKHTREKAMRSFSTVLRLMDEYDDYVFLQTQPQLYKYIEQDCPSLYSKIRQRIGEGRWEVDGGMWLEADCNVTSGESLVRQLLFGIQFIKQKFDVNCEYLWLPDVFGYSWALPQILKLCNIKTFMTTKISWNQYNSMPNDLFLWKGIDGSEILTYFITTPHVNSDISERRSTYNGELEPKTVIGSWEKFRNKNISHNVLISYGYGDGGGGVNRDMLEMRRVMDKLPSIPNVKQTLAGDFFNLLHSSLQRSGENIPKWDGELYLEYHRGTYTTQAYNKKANRRLEFMLAETEWLSCQALLSGHKYERETLNECWEIVLRNQFHDIIPGSSISEVYSDSAVEYNQAFELLSTLREKVISNITEPGEQYFTLCNFSSFERRDAVFIPVKKEGEFTCSEGRRLASQKTNDGYYVDVKSTPLSIYTISFEEIPVQPQNSAFDINIERGLLESCFYNIRWDESGRIQSIFDKENSREIIDGNGCGNVIEIFEDKPINFDAWDIDIFYLEKKELAVLTQPPTIIANGPLFLTLRFIYTYNQSKIEQDMTIYTNSRRIDFFTKVNWHERHRLLKTAFSLDIRSTKATFDIQFGHVERATHNNTNWDIAKFESVGHKWADLSENGYGVSLLNDCKYGYSIKDNIMRLSLLKSSKYPDENADMGFHEFTYSLLPHSGDLITGKTIEEATALNIPITISNGCDTVGSKRIFKINSSSVNIDAVKQSEDGECIILRLHECNGGRSKITIESDYGIKQFSECNLLEQSYTPPILGNVVSTEVKPFEIKTYRIWF